MSPEIHPLFPIAIFKTSIRKLTQTELECILSKKLESQSLGNSVSFDRHLLNDPKLNDLKSLMLDAIKVYAKETYGLNFILLFSSALRCPDKIGQYSC
jgi:hypothetical protein